MLNIFKSKKIIKVALKKRHTCCKYKLVFKSRNKYMAYIYKNNYINYNRYIKFLAPNNKSYVVITKNINKLDKIKSLLRIIGRVWFIPLIYLYVRFNLSGRKRVCGTCKYQFESDRRIFLFFILQVHL